MSYATLMVYVDADGAPEARVRLAAGLADKFNATLIGVSALAAAPIMPEGILVQSLTEVELREMRAKLADRGNWFRRIAGGDHRRLEWRAVLEFPTDALTREARSADLIVIGHAARTQSIYGSLDPAGVVLTTGRPTLVVPDAASALRADHVVIGWRDTREARRAVQDALPLLHQASRVTVVEICASGEESAARQHLDDVARYLERHRISGGPRVILQRGGSGASLLIRLAQDEGADLLVTGAYGHSRLGEWIFGGVSRDLLATSPICCLMSH
jgi:nucleotide-binding universal stress UspA family protein